MSLSDDIMERVLEKTGATQVFTYPGSPPRHLLKHVYDRDDVDMMQTVREQHLLHMAQTRYYRQMEDGDGEIPVVIVSGEMGESMMFQPLIAGSISCPCLIIVGEGSFPHVENSVNIDHQTDRGATPEKLDGEQNILTEHENVDERMLFRGEQDLEPLADMIDRLRNEHGIGIVHIPIYAHQSADNEELLDVLEQQPDDLNAEQLQQQWANAERPLLLVGRGCKLPERREQIRSIAEASGATIVTTLQMDGYFDTNYAGRIGIMGTPSANEAFFQSDQVIAVGASIKNTLTSFEPDIVQEFKEKTIQIEEDRHMRSVFAGAWYEDDVDAALSILAERTGESWFDEAYGLEPLQEYVPDTVRSLGTVLRDEFPDKVVNFGVGNTLLWLPYVLGPDIRKEVSRSGSMGEAVAGLNREDRPVIVMGDGEFEMDLSILTEAQYWDTGATIIIVNNERLGLVTERQKHEFGEIITPKAERPINYESLGDGFEGVKSVSVKEPDAVADAVRDAVNSDTINIIEIQVDDYLAPELFDPNILPRLEQ